MGLPRFAKMVADQRKLLGLSQLEVAKQLKMTLDMVGLVERGRRRPSLAKLPGWARTLKLDLDRMALTWLSDGSAEVAGVLRGLDGERSVFQPSEREIDLLVHITRLDEDVREAVDVIVRRLAR